MNTVLEGCHPANINISQLGKAVGSQWLGWEHYGEHHWPKDSILNNIVGESQTTIDKERNLNKGGKVGIGALEYFRKHCNKAVDGVPVLLCIF